MRRLAATLLTRCTALLLIVSVAAWPGAMAMAGASPGEAHHGAMAHRSMPQRGAPAPHHRTATECCEACLVACAGHQMVKAPPSTAVVETILVVLPPRIVATPIALSCVPDFRLPPPLGPPAPIL